MSLSDYAAIGADFAALLSDFFSKAPHKPGALMVIGCSTSEILGGHIGKAGSEELGKILAAEILSAARTAEIFACVQCCEHLNRALVIEEEAAEKFGLSIVSAVPKPHAGGSLAAAYYLGLKQPVLAEGVAADLGLDIGQTLIGMHLKRVAVPLRLGQNRLGQAIITAAYCRPPLIGGERAQYHV